MACFVVPMAEAIVITILKKVVEKKEKNAVDDNSVSKTTNQCISGTDSLPSSRIRWSRKLSWLNALLWGGVLLLAFEHLWHGEIVPWPPFFTAMNNPENIGPMLHEIATFGTSMAAFVTAVWTVIVFIAEHKAKQILVKESN